MVLNVIAAMGITFEPSSLLLNMFNVGRRHFRGDFAPVYAVVTDVAFHVDVIGIGGYRLFGKVISDWMLVPSYLAATMAATRRNDKLS